MHRDRTMKRRRLLQRDLREKQQSLFKLQCTETSKCYVNAIVVCARVERMFVTARLLSEIPTSSARLDFNKQETVINTAEFSMLEMGRMNARLQQHVFFRGALQARKFEYCTLKGRYEPQQPAWLDHTAECRHARPYWLSAQIPRSPNRKLQAGFNTSPYVAVAEAPYRSACMIWEAGCF